jgi:uncharacterized membrane protein
MRSATVKAFVVNEAVGFFDEKLVLGEFVFFVEVWILLQYLFDLLSAYKVERGLLRGCYIECGFLIQKKFVESYELVLCLNKDFDTFKAAISKQFFS